MADRPDVTPPDQPGPAPDDDCPPEAAPCGRAVHADPDEPPTPEQEPLPLALARKPQASKSAAEWAYQRLILYIRNFESRLDSEHEIAMGITGTGSGSGFLRIEGIGYFDPDIITFYGTDHTGAKAQVIQHVTQLSVVLRAAQKPGEAAEPRRIGFRLAAELEQAEVRPDDAAPAPVTAPPE